MNTVKNKMRRIMKKMISMVITLAMLVQYLPVNWLQDVFADEINHAISVSFKGNDSLKEAGKGNYLMSSSEIISMSINLKPNWNKKDGYSSGTKLKLALPWFYYNENNNIVFTTDPKKTKDENQNVEFIGGVEARISSKPNAWSLGVPTDNDYGWGSDYDETTGNKAEWRRTSLEVNSQQVVRFQNAETFNVEFRFFTKNGATIPENASAEVAVGASYDSFYSNSDSLISSSGYSILPGRSPLEGEDKDDMRIINIVNSNLDWTTKVRTVSSPILWDQYNYVVYAVDIANNSKDKSDIDHFRFDLDVPNYQSKHYGVLEKDMMAWKVGADGTYEENKDITDRESSYGGIYGKGGVLIWDMSKETEPTNFDLETFVKSHGEKSQFTYNYPQFGRISVKVGGDKNTDGQLKKGESRTYYVAVPYVNNFGDHTTERQRVDLMQTIYFGGRNLAWTKQDNDTFLFETQKTGFQHDKYLLNASNKESFKEEVALGRDFSYYLDKFQNTSNTPVFNAYTVDTLPEKFNLTSLTVEMNNNGKPDDWFKTDSTKGVDLSDIISLKFTDKSGKETWVSLKQLGVAVTEDGNQWKLEKINDAITDYLRKNSGYEFARDVKFEFKERIASQEALDGRIIVTGNGKYLIDYKNTLNTSYEKWTWSSVPIEGKNEEGFYVKRLETIETAEAVAKGKHVQPNLYGYGVLHGSTSDQVNRTQEVSLANENAAVRFTLGNASDSLMLPAEFNISKLIKSNGAGLVAKDIRLSPDLIANSKIDSIELTNTDKKKFTINYSSLKKEKDGSILIPKTSWTGQLDGIKINFDEFSGNVENAKAGCYVEVNGSPNAIGSYNFNGNFTTKYGIDTVQEDVAPATATLNVKCADPDIEGYGVLHDATDPTDSSKDTVKNGQQVSLGDENSAYRFRLGNTSAFDMTPAEFNATGLLKEKSSGVYAGLEASSIYFSPTLVSNSDIDSIVLKDADGNTTLTISADDIKNMYTKADNSILIPSSVWKGTISNLSDVKVKFKKFEANVLNTQKDCYIEINGMPNSTGTLICKGEFTTKYSSHDGLVGNVQEKDVTANAQLSVRSVEPIIEANAVYKTTSSVNTPAPNKSSKVDPSNPTYYEFKIGNSSESKVTETNLIFDLLSVGNVNKKAGVETLKGFDTEKFVIKDGYKKAMDIEKIEFFDYDQDPDTDRSRFTIDKSQLASYINSSNNDIEISSTSFPNSMKRVKVIKVITSRFDKKITGSDCVVAQIYGNTDAYNDYYTSKKLEASLLFKPVGKLYNDSDSKTGSAAFNVKAEQLDIDNSLYQEDVSSESVSKSSNTDLNEQTLGVPYGRDFTYRVALWNTGNSYLDDVETKIDVPTLKSDGSGFHATSITIYKELLDQYKDFNDKYTFESIEFVRKPSTISTLVNSKITMKYDAKNGELTLGSQTYTDNDGKFSIPIEDVTDNKNCELESIILKGKNFVINKDQKGKIEPYVEIGGWSDADIGAKNILETTATHYLDSMEEDENKAYRIKTNDTANAYQSKMYYDTTIVAGYNDNNPSQRFTATSTPVEHVRLSDCSGDNSELEVGYKGLGSYAVDFRQYLNVGSNLPQNEHMSYQDLQDMSYIKLSSLNTAANIEMNVTLPKDYFDTYYLKVNKRVKQYIKEIVVTRKDGSSYTIDKAALADKFIHNNPLTGEGDYARINLLTSEDDFTNGNVFSEKESDYYKQPTSKYDVSNPIEKAKIVLDINQEATTKDSDGNTVANVPDYGTWWDEQNDTTKYMFEFGGRFYKTGVANASVSSTVTIGGENNKQHKNSKKRTLTGSPEHPKGIDKNNKTTGWSYLNYYSRAWYGGNYSYKANDLYSLSHAIVVRDFDRVSKGATSSYTVKSNTNAKIADDNKYLINFTRSTRCYSTYEPGYQYQYEAGSNGSWYYQDPDDWINKLSYADQVDIEDTLGKIIPDETYDYKGTLTTGLQIHKELANYFKKGEAALTLTLGTGDTVAEQQQNKVTKIFTKDDLVYDNQSGYYVIKFNNDNDKSSTVGKTGYINGTYYLNKHQYVLSFKITMYDIQGNGEYNSEIGNKYYKYTDADGTVQQDKIDKFGLTTDDIIVDVKPYTVCDVDTVADATNKIETKTYLDDNNDKNTNVMDSDSGYKNYSSAYIMGYRIPFNVGYQLESLGADAIDINGDVNKSTDPNKRNISDYHTKDGKTYTKLDNSNYTEKQNKTPTNAQFGVKVYNQTDSSNDEHKIPARIRDVTTTDTMNQYYRMRNIYLPKQWINDGTDSDPSSKTTANGQWFKLSKLNVKINNQSIQFVPTKDANGKMVLQADKTGTALKVDTINLDTTKKVNGQECYVINIENFVRQNYNAGYTSLVSGPTNDDLVKVIVNSFSMTFVATHQDFKNDDTVMSNGQYLTATKTNNNTYSYFYDGVYVDRTKDDFLADNWTDNSVPTFSGEVNTFSVGNQSNSGSILPHSIDNNAQPWTYTSDKILSDYYNLRNVVARLQPTLTRERTFNGNSQLFAYDQDGTNTNESSKTVEVDKNHLMPYDYVEYTLSATNEDDAEIPLNHTHMSFKVKEGQQIVGWKLVDASDVIDKVTGSQLTATDIKATLKDDSGNSLNDSSGNPLKVKAEKDYSSNANGEDTHYRTIDFEIGSEGTQIPIGKTVKLCIITQLTDEVNGSATKDKKSFEGQYVNASAYTQADPKHGFAQYYIDKADNYNHRSDASAYKTVAKNNVESARSYYRYYKGSDFKEFISRIDCRDQLYDNGSLAISYAFEDNEFMFDSQGARLTVSKIKNDTMHFVDAQTVTVNFLDENNRQGFVLDNIPTVGLDASDNADIYYPADMVAQVGRDKLKPIKVEYYTSDDKKWHTVDYSNLPDITKIHKITSIRWTYFDVPSRDNQQNTNNDVIIFDDVTLIGQARYEDVRDDKSVKRKDKYLSVDSATITHTKNYEKKVRNDDISADKITVSHEVSLNETINTTQDVYREAPQITLHPQVFDNENDAAATYNENASQKIGYRPNDKYWQKITLINRKMVDASNTQNARQGRLIEPVIYDKLPTDYLKSLPKQADIHFTWTDVNDAPVAGDYRIEVTDTKLGEEKDYAGNMIYKKSGLKNSRDYSDYDVVDSVWGTKAFDDLDTSDTNTLDTNYTLRKYKIIDKSTNKPITMNIGDKLSIYYELEVVEDNLPMVYVDEDKNLDTTDDRHPAYFPRVGEYYQYKESYAYYNGNGLAFPFSNENQGETTYHREIQNSDRQMDMNYLLHDVGVTATPNNYEKDGIVHDNIDTWEFLKESIVYIPGDGKHTSYENTRYGGGNNVLADYDISSLNNAQKTIYTPQQRKDDVNADLPDYGEGKTSLILKSGNNEIKRDWYELVVKKRTIANETYNSSAADASKCGSDNWGSKTPIVWGENRLHLQKAWLVSASEFVDATLDSDNNLVDNDQSKEHRIYQTTEGDSLNTNYPSNPNYRVTNDYYGNNKNQLHSAVDDNYEVGLEYNEEFTTKLQALNYGDWDLGHGVEFTYTMPRGIEPLILDENGNPDVTKLKAEVLKSVKGVTSTNNHTTDQQTVDETYETIDSSQIKVDIIQKPTTQNAKYQAPKTWQDPQFTDEDKTDYKTGDGTTPWVLKITVDASLKKWFNRGEDRGYKLNLYIPSKVVGINEDQQWYDRLQTRPYVPDDDTSYQDYYYYQILDIDHFEGTTKENMQHNQRYGMDYMWYRGDGNSMSYYYSSPTFYYYNGSPNTPYVDGYNIQDQEVTISDGKAKPTKNNANYGKADSHNRYAQTGTRAVMRKPLLRQWTTVGNDITGHELSDYYVDTEGSNTKLNIHVENKYYWDELGTNCEKYYSNSYTNGTKEKHSYATDGGGRGTYMLPVITNILPYGVAPVGEKNGKNSVYSAKVDENGIRTLSWDLLDTNGKPLSTSEKELYDVKVTYEQIAKVDSDGNKVTDKDGKKVTEGRYVVRFYPTKQATDDLSAVIKSGEGRTFSFNTFVYASPKVDTLDGENKDLQDSYESNYTYISSTLDDFDAITDEDIEGNPYTVASEAYNDTNYINRSENEYAKPENRPDAIQKTYTKYYNVKQTYGNLPNSKVTDKVNGKDYYVVGQGMTRVEEDKEKAKDDSYIFNIEDYVKDKDGNTIRNSLVLNKDQSDFNLNRNKTHQNYDQESSDLAFVNTTKIRAGQPSLRLENYVSSSKDEVGKKTPNKDENGEKVEKGSVEYTYDDDGDPMTDEVTKKFDYGDDVWYTAKLINKPEDENDYARRGSVNHSRFVFSFHLPKTVSITDLPNYDSSADWDQFRDDDFVIEIEHEDGTKETVTPNQLKGSGFGIRIINKKYTPTSPKKDHTGQIVTYEVTTPKDENFDSNDYASFVDGNKPAGYLKTGDSLSLKIRTRVDNKEYGVDPSDTSGVDVWTGYYSEAYSTLHTTDGEYIVTDAGKIYDKDDTIPAGETIVYDGYTFNKNANRDYDKSFTKQVKMKWVDGVTDSKDVKDEDGSLEECNDYDQDEVYDENFVYGSSASINIVKPKATTRIDTSELRHRINDLDADIAIIDDAHVKSSNTMYLRLTKVANDQAKLNQFITSVSIPYYGTNKATVKPATSKDSIMNTEVQEIRTGNWLLPTGIDNYNTYKDHLKVYLYAYLVDKPSQESGVITPNDAVISPDDSNWTPIGDPNGYALTANKTIGSEELNQPVQAQLNGKYIYQLNWVVKMEGFTDGNDNTYTADNAAINYPVPVGLKLDTTGTDGQDVDEKDKERNNTSEAIMHDPNVVNNCAYVSVKTGPHNTIESIAKHVNFFARSYGKYDDNKYSALTKDDRAGYYIDPELPTLRIDMRQAYFKPNSIDPSDGSEAYTEFGWSYENPIIDDKLSKVLKYRVSMINERENNKEIRSEDNATNPNITVALPYNENLDLNKLTYVEYGSANNYLDDTYTSNNESLDQKIPLWTWYIVNEDNTIEKPSDGQSVIITDNSPAKTSKPIAADRKESSKILNFYFKGKLKPGQTLKVEIMSPVERMNASAISSELLRCKGYIFKDGAFNAYMPDQTTANPSAYEYDSQDVNENKRYNDAALTKMTTAVGFSKVEYIEQSKLVDTEVETNVTSRPAAVNEGGDYTFKVSSRSPYRSKQYTYSNNLIYDVLPYDEDYYAYNLTSGKKTERESKWNGWLKLDSIHVKETNTSSNDVTLDEIDSNQYDVWVGPIIKDGSKYVLNVDSDGKPILPDQKKLQNEDYIKTLTATNSAERSNYFVKLSELQQYLKNADEDEKEQLTKGIRAIWLQMKDDYQIKPAGRLELSYTMHTPQNLPKYVGDVKVDGSSSVSSFVQIAEAVKDIVGWNSALSRARLISGNSYQRLESVIAGVYPDAPSGKGYIGSYVWQDINYNGEKDEAKYEDTYGIGRDLFKEAKYDLNGDGKVDKKDDPGINGVKVELLTEHGRPANKDGEAIQKTEDGKYLIINDETGQPELNDEGSSTERYRYSTSGPATFDTESDYYGNKGYFIFSNLKPGKYNLRYTLPDGYTDYSVTTKQINTTYDQKSVIVYRNGQAVYGNQTTANAQTAAYPVENDKLVAQTAQGIEVTAVEEDATKHKAYDKKVMSYDLGVGRTNLYKGTAWKDETVKTNGDIEINGYMDDDEERLAGIRVEAYEVDQNTSKPISNTPALDADGNPASYVTKGSDVGNLLKGEYQFRLVPGKSYIIKAFNESGTPLKPTSPINSNDPTADTKYNDLLLQPGGQLVTNRFDVPYILGKDIKTWKDYPTNDTGHTIDLGFVDSSRGFIGEFVWDDANYNGIQDYGESPIENVTVTLEQYYYNGTQWIKLDKEEKTQTSKSGIYKFTVSTYHTVNGENYLMGYKVRIDSDDNKNLFETSAPTLKDQTNDGTQSDLDEQPTGKHYYLTDDIVIMAKTTSSTTQDSNVKDYNGVSYDIGNAETMNFDAGFKDYESGKLDGIVWLDDNYDGIRDANETIADGTKLNSNQSRLKEVKAQVKGYYYDNGTWHEAPDTWTTNSKEVLLKLNSDGYYHYTFDDLPTEIQINGKTYLMGYKVTLDNIDKTLKPTLSYQTDSDKDSSLVVRNKIYTLMKPNEYAVIAKELSANDTVNTGTTETVNGITYDMLRHQNVKDYDAGLTGIENSGISGQVWKDQNYDGIQDAGEAPIKDINVRLIRYTVTEGSDGKLKYTEDKTFTRSTKTDDKGAYNFTGLEASPNDGSSLYAYQVVISPKDTENRKILEGESERLGITKYHKGKDSTKDSDWSNNGTLIDNSGEYLILLNKETASTPDDNKVLGYDIVKGKSYDNLNAGATPYQNASISGNIFDDLDYDGLNTDKDNGYKGIDVILTQYQKVGDEYIPTGAAEAVTTDDDGNYVFDNLPTNGYDLTDDRVIYAYTVTVKEVPNDYVITKYHKDGKRYSNMDPTDLVLKDKSGNPYIILAKKSDDDKLAQYLDGYDLIENKNKDNYDGGITKYHSGIISGTIFDDKDYNGLLGKDDKGYQGINVILSQYQKVGDEYFLTGMIDSVETDENGKYTFSNIATYGTNEEGERVLYAYRVTLDEDSLPEGYGVTRYRVNDKDESSKLSSKDYELITNKENQFKDSTEPYIIMAEKTDDDSIPYNIEGYDIVGNNSIKHLNGGITRIQTGSISGKIFNDDDYDGLSTKDDKGFEGIEISLKQYYLKDNEYVLTDKEFTCKTTSDGSYKFDQLPTNGIENDEHVIYYYKAFVKIDTLPSGYAITKYHVGKDDTKDSDLLSESGELLGKDQYMVLVDKADKDNVQSIVNGYDIITAKDIKYLDGGLTSYNQGTIEGTLWIDANRNGIIDKNESYLSHQKMILKGYYYKDNQWIEESSLDSEVETDENGKYNFSHLATTITKDEQTYLTGYQVSLDALPKDKKITEYLKNNGKDDSKLKDEDLRLIYTQYEKDGYLIVAGRFDEDNINNQSSNYEGYNAIKAIDIKDMNAGFYDPDKPVMTGNPIIQLLQRIKTGDNVSIMGYVLLGLISCGIIVLIVFKKRKDNE